MKQILPFALLMLLVSCVSSNGDEPIDTNHSESSTFVSIDEARLEVLKIQSEIQKVKVPGTKKSANIESEFTVHASTPTRGEEELLSKDVYIYNFENNEGFAIMSSDKKLPSLLAYSENGQLNPTDSIDNPGLIMFLSNLEVYIKDRSIQDGPVIIQPNYERTDYGDWETIVYHPGGLCKVKWGQGSPYNNYCPIKDDKRCLTGCVATAAAQLMSVYKYPLTYNGYSFPWDEMTKYKYGDNCSQQGIDGIARLMQQLGLRNNLNMNYGVNASGAEADRIFLALENFGYSKPGLFEDFNSKNVLNDLSNGYPVITSGYCFKTTNYFLGIKVGTTYSGGHAWLLHGLIQRKREVRTYNAKGVLISSYYESFWYPQCNWGWKDKKDGYYLINAFDASKNPVYADSYSNTSETESSQTSGEVMNFQYKLKSHTGIRK